MVPEVQESDALEDNDDHDVDSPMADVAVAAVSAIDEEQTGDLHPIDCLQDRKKIRNKTFYLVKWTGYDVATWQPAGDIPLAIRQAFNASKGNDA